MEFSAITANNKEINFTIKGVETVKYIGLYNDVIPEA